MATVLRSSLIDILTAIKTRLMTLTGFPAERVKIVADWPDRPQIVGDQDVLVRGLGFVVPPQEGAEGGGRVETLLHRRLGVMIRTRLAYDEEQDETGWLTDPTLGHIQLEEKVFNLQNFIPQDTNQNWLSTPLQLQAGEDATKSPAEDGNGYEVIYFDITYLPPIDQSII